MPQSAPLTIDLPGSNFPNPQARDIMNVLGITDNTVLIGAIPFLLFYVGRVFIRRWVRDGSEIAKDRAETDIIAVLQEDNRSLRKAHEEAIIREQKMAEERNEALSQMGKFLAESESNKNKISEMQASMEIMSKKLEEQSLLLNELLLENAKLKAQIGILSDLNDRFKNEVDRLSKVKYD